MLIVVLALAVLIGVSLGLLGGGGSILTVPILTMAAGMETKAAIAASLFVVAVTSAAGVISHARAGRVRWRVGIVFGVAGMAGAFGGGRIAAYIPGTVLMILFGLMMAATAIAMLRKPRVVPVAPGAAGAAFGSGTAESVTASATETVSGTLSDLPAASPELAPVVERPLPTGKVILEGIVVGVVTGLVGAGGGFLVVPALVLLGGLRMDTAVGTSLVVISLKSFAGLAGHLGHVDLDWPLVLAVTGMAIAGSFVGGALAGRIPPAALRRGFGVFIIVMAVVVLARELLG